MGGVLGQGAPDAMNAAGFSDSPHLFFSGYDKKGEWFQLFQIGFGGIPGRPVGDGPDGHSLWPGIHQCAERIHRSLLSTAHRQVRADRRFGWRRAAPGWQRSFRGLRVPG